METAPVICRCGSEAEDDWEYCSRECGVAEAFEKLNAGETLATSPADSDNSKSQAAPKTYSRSEKLPVSDSKFTLERLLDVLGQDEARFTYSTPRHGTFTSSMDSGYRGGKSRYEPQPDTFDDEFDPDGHSSQMDETSKNVEYRLSSDDSSDTISCLSFSAIPPSSTRTSLAMNEHGESYKVPPFPNATVLPKGSVEALYSWTSSPSVACHVSLARTLKKVSRKIFSKFLKFRVKRLPSSEIDIYSATSGSQTLSLVKSNSLRNHPPTNLSHIYDENSTTGSMSPHTHIKNDPSDNIPFGTSTTSVPDLNCHIFGGVAPYHDTEHHGGESDTDNPILGPGRPLYLQVHPVESTDATYLGWCEFVAIQAMREESGLGGTGPPCWRVRA